MAAEKAVERVNSLEDKIEALETKINQQLSTIAALIRLPHSEETSVDAHIEGESSHHIHFHGNHHSSKHRTPKLEMYKFDG